jgi:hypothetical protein
MGAMTSGRSIAGHLAPWWGFLLGLPGWALSDQTGSSLAFDHCEALSMGMALLIGAAGLVLALAGGALSFRVWRSDEEDQPRRFIARVAVGAAVLFAIAIVLQTVATVVIPRCHA